MYKTKVLSHTKNSFNNLLNKCNKIINFKCLFCDKSITKLKLHYGIIFKNNDGTIYIENFHSKCIECVFD